MPTPTTAKLPKPKSADEFEDIVHDALTVHWDTPNVERNGRRGQGQQGVDIYARVVHLNGGYAGAQCKNVERLTIRLVLEEVAKALDFKPRLSEFLLVCGGERDAAVQEQIRRHFDEKPAPFPVTLLFWPDVVSALARSPDMISLFITPSTTYPSTW